jgi:small subunit ribosomal protein S11
MTTEEIKQPEATIKPEEIIEDGEFLGIDKDVKEEPAGEVDPLADLPEEVRKKLEKKTATGDKGKKGKGKGKKKKKGERKVSVGKAFIHSSYNNTIVSLTDLDGNVLSWASAGIAGFKGPKKSTPYAASIITKIAVLKAKDFGLTEVSVFVKGVGTGRESAIRALNANGLEITFIKDITPIPHNGCRRKKPRRV